MFLHCPKVPSPTEIPVADTRCLTRHRVSSPKIKRLKWHLGALGSPAVLAATRPGHDLAPTQKDTFPSYCGTRCAPPSPRGIRRGLGLYGSFWSAGVMLGSLNWGRAPGTGAASSSPGTARTGKTSAACPGTMIPWPTPGRGRTAAHPTESSSRAAQTLCPAKSSPNTRKSQAKHANACGMHTALLPAGTLPARSWADS